MSFEKKALLESKVGASQSQKLLFSKPELFAKINTPEHKNSNEP